MIHFSISPLTTSLRIDDESVYAKGEILAIIRENTRARPEGYKFMPKYRSGMWDGYINLLKGSTIPTGLTRTVIDALKSSGFVVKATLNYELPQHPSVDANTLNGIQLRPYQVDAANTLLSKTRGIARMATGSGKTEVIAAMIKVLGLKTLVLTTKVDLLHQTAERLSKRLGEPIGKVGDGIRDVKRVTVATIQTLCKPDVLGMFMTCGVIIFDECHHIPSKTAQDVMLKIPATYRYGVSGTPINNGDLNDLLLVAATGNVAYELSASELCGMGMAAQPNIIMYNVTDGSNTSDYQEAYTENVVRHEVRNQMIMQELQGEFNAALVLVDRLEHGDLLKALYPKAEYANGSMPSEERERILKTLSEGNGKVVIATPIFDEGVDVPAVDLVILAAAGKSPIKLLQRVGRGMRPKATGNNSLRVIDFIDFGKHLLKQSHARALLYEAEGFNVEMKQCTH